MTPLDHPTQSLPALRDFLRGHLLEDIIPFWMRHALDPAGGVNSCIEDDGRVVSRDKWLWSQWRFVWLMSRMHQWFGPDQRWLAAARSTADFCLAHGWDEQAEGWRLALDGQGNPLRGYESIYTDAFAIYGLTALGDVTGQTRYLDWARRTADAALVRLDQPHDRIPHFPYPIPQGARVHGIPMIFALIFWELGQLLDEPRYREAALAMQRDIFANFYRPDRDLILERIAQDGSEYPPPLGTAVNPGHVEEDLWFEMLIAQDRGDTAMIDQCVRLVRRHVEVGWDQTYGGLYLACDADGRTEVGWNFADTKQWWPQVEAMVALLMAYAHSGERWCLDWYDKVHRYAFGLYPNATDGEWRQRMSRDGSPLGAVVTMPVKDPFHLPRALMYCVRVLEKLTR